MLKPSLSRFFLLGLTALFSFNGFFQSAPALAQSPIIQKLYTGIYAISAEVAADYNTRQTGLMHRSYLPINHGMLFVFERHATHCFWMKNTLIPLTIAFLDDDGTIVNLADMKPHDESNHCPNKPIRFALEMEQNWFQTRHIQAGQKILGLSERY